MANKTIQELRDFVTQQMPSNSELLVKPFRTFFFYLLDRLADIPDATGFNELLQKIFGTTDIGSVNYQEIFGQSFQGTNLIAYLLYLRSTTPDLIDGKIPYNQIPDLSSYFRIGEIITTNNTVEVKLPIDENNTYSSILISINGIIAETTQSPTFTYTPVSLGNIKILKLYGLLDNNVIYLAEGVEGVEGVEPQLPLGALYIKTIIVTSDNQTIGSTGLDNITAGDNITIDYTNPKNPKINANIAIIYDYNDIFNN